MPGYPLSRGIPSFGILALSRGALHAGVPAPSRGTRSGHGRARLHLKQFQIKLQFKISPNVGVSRVSGAALPSQSRPGSSD